MKTVAVAVAALALQVVAESLDKADYFPECSLDCLTEAIEKSVECKETDSICLCDHENYEAIYEYTMDCVIDACGEDVAIDEVLPAAEPYCSDATSLYSATATSPLPSHTHSHDEEEEEEEEDHTHEHSHDTTAAESAAESTAAAATTKEAAESEAPETTAASTAAETAAATTSSVEVVSTGAAGQFAPMGAAAMLAMGALAAF
ncbi:hypothetical protein BHE90_007835 [Fusarium euwallaceae]|uniref:CFEM domain-containing protein n=2 Tax=Fusarium solani species complex TaxID=232080 RepID=A0A430LPP7_9HYPO|nr:hypothetical protein CDV31_005249 [Fusarium ambrosium]RTE77708.1 hypothetical protein BHE90_007835 [Fusarium euwallaceae]